ncbi:MAG: ABC transporter ATP-binding protein [Bacillota bacterium]
MKFLLEKIKPYQFLFCITPLFIMMDVVPELVLPKIMITMIDTVATTSDVSLISPLVIQMVVLTIFGVLSGLIGLYTASCVSQKVGSDLRKMTFAKIQDFSFDTIDTFRLPSLITRLTNDITQIQLMIITSLRMLTKAPFLCVGSVFMAYTINAEMATALLGITIFLAIIIVIIMKKSSPRFDANQEALDGVNGTIRESLWGVRVVKAFVREDYELEKFRKANETYRERGIYAYRLIIVLFPIFMIMLNGSVVLILYFGGDYVRDGLLRSEELVAMISYMMHMMNSLLMLGNAFTQMSKAKISLNRIQEVLDEPIDLKDGTGDGVPQMPKGEITFSNVTYAYKNQPEVKVMDEVNFQIRAGTRIGILGETGSGKSTLVHLLLRMYDVSRGEILLDGTNINAYTMEQLHERISVVLQETTLFSGTIRENICWGKKEATQEEIERATKAAQAHDFIMQFPDGYDTLLGQKGVNLSGGQKQRISIARTLIQNPSVIIFDDSTSAVDSLTEQKIVEEMEQTHGSATKIIIAQKISSVMHLDKILVLEKGKIVAEGTHEELSQNSVIYLEIYDSQREKGGEQYA